MCRLARGFTVYKHYLHFSASAFLSDLLHSPLLALPPPLPFDALRTGSTLCAWTLSFGTVVSAPLPQILSLLPFLFAPRFHNNPWPLSPLQHLHVRYIVARAASREYGHSLISGDIVQFLFLKTYTLPLVH